MWTAAAFKSPSSLHKVPSPRNPILFRSLPPSSLFLSLPRPSQAMRRSSLVPPVKFSIGSELDQGDISKEAPGRRFEMEMICSGPTTTTEYPVGLRILIHKPEASTALCTIINKTALTRSISGVHYPRTLPGAPKVMGFLQACRLCKKKLSLGKDVYMYRGDQAFCSVDCRCEQILLDEMCEREELIRLGRRSKRVSSPLRCKAGENHAQESHRRRNIWATG